MKYFYKIKNTKTGLYKSAGYGNFRWSKEGKVWKNIAALMGHFAMYGRRNRTWLAENTPDWIVEMYSTEPVETKSVADFLKERWEK